MVDGMGAEGVRGVISTLQCGFDWSKSLKGDAYWREVRENLEKQLRKFEGNEVDPNDM